MSTLPWVYFIEADGSSFVKVGFTAGEPSARLRQLQTGSPALLRLLYAVPVLTRQAETALLRYFRESPYPVRGEWVQRDAAEAVIGGAMANGHCLCGVFEALTGRRFECVDGRASGADPVGVYQ